jgi:hypothetical protein
MKNVVRLTEGDLMKIVTRVIEEQSQNQNQFTFPIDVILTDGSLIGPAKIKIPRGTIMNWDSNKRLGTMKVGNSFITIAQADQGAGTAESTALIFKVNGKSYFMQWADSVFGVVYNKQYQDVAEKIYDLLG